MLGKSLLLSFALAVVTVSAQNPQAVRESETHFARGVAAQTRGEMEAARTEYEAALKFVPRRFDALSNLGVVFARLGQYEQAIKRYTEALVIEPRENGVRFNLGVAHFKVEDFTAAQNELSKVVLAQPDNNQARLLLGLCFLQLGKLSEATVNLERVYKAEPDNIAAAYALGSTYISADRVESAKVLVDKVFRRLDSAEGHLIVGALSIAAKDFPKGITELSEAARLNAKLPTVHSQLGNAHLFSGDREQAMKEFVLELENNPRDFNAVARLGWLYREDGKLDEADALLKRALELRPGDGHTMYQLAQLAQARGATEEAVTLLEKVVAQQPDFTPAHVLLARLYFKLKRVADGERERGIIERLNAEQQKNQPAPEATQTAMPGGMQSINPKP